MWSLLQWNMHLVLIAQALVQIPVMQCFSCVQEGWKDGTVTPKFRQGKFSPLFLTAKFSPRNNPLTKFSPSLTHHQAGEAYQNGYVTRRKSWWPHNPWRLQDRKSGETHKTATHPCRWYLGIPKQGKNIKMAMGAFSHSTRTAPIVMSFILGTPLKTIHLQKHA